MENLELNNNDMLSPHSLSPKIKKRIIDMEKS